MDFDTNAAVETERKCPGYYKTITWQQRLMVANYLNNIKYNFPENEPPKMDKTIFRMRLRE